VKIIPDIVDDNGDIQLHGRQGVVISVNFVDDNDLPRDMTGVSVTFECGTGINKTLVAGATTDELLLELTNADIKVIYAASNKDFVVLDNTAPEPTPLWVGTVYIYGWVE
jgi:hypothetical protein